jgi:hypothetical protein
MICTNNSKEKKDMKDIIIYKSQNADTRSAKQGTTKDELEKDTLSHINDVQSVGYWLADKFKNQLADHDHTKLDYIDEFYNDFNEKLTNGTRNFKEMKWFKERHMTERHHLNDSVPDDVNLLDVLEMVVDCTCAGLARSGDVYSITIPQEVIEKAIENTKNLIIDNAEVVEAEAEDIEE